MRNPKVHPVSYWTLSAALIAGGCSYHCWLVTSLYCNVALVLLLVVTCTCNISKFGINLTPPVCRRRSVGTSCHRRLPPAKATQDKLNVKPISGSNHCTPINSASRIHRCGFQKRFITAISESFSRVVF